MHGEDLLVDDSGDRKAVETIGKSLPQLDVVATLALVVKTIDTVDRSALVVTSEDEEVFGILDLVGKEQADGLKRLLASIDVVTEEEIVVLSVDITADLEGTRKSLEFEEDGLRDEDLTSLGAKITDLGLKKLNLLSRSAASHLE
ncbi:hypothetical protein HG530_002946 [Fusarium avenaceum]|nr:hypothetical protein HG530_002946 [Fusarium avenaceum]